MTQDEAQKLIELLADGIDPQTGEVLPNGHLLHHRDCVRALSIAAQALMQSAMRVAAKTAGPANVGAPWTSANDAELQRLFLAGDDVGALAKQFQRTRGSIQARLVRLGLLKPTIGNLPSEATK